MRKRYQWIALSLLAAARRVLISNPKTPVPDQNRFGSGLLGEEGRFALTLRWQEMCGTE